MESTDDLCMECKAAMFDKMQARTNTQPAQQENPFAQSAYAPPAETVQNPFAPPVQAPGVYGQNPFAPPVQPQAGKKKNPRMLGFGRALTGAILAFFGLLIGYMAMEAMVLELYEDAVAYLFMSLPGAVIGVVFGALSLALAVRTKKATDLMPIPALILGITGVAYGGFGVLLDFIACGGVLAAY